MNIILTKKCNELSSSDFLRGCDNNDASVGWQKIICWLACTALVMEIFIVMVVKYILVTSYRALILELLHNIFGLRL